MFEQRRQRWKPNWGWIVFASILLLCGVLIAAVYRASQAQDLVDIATYNELKQGWGDQPISRPRDLLTDLQDAAYLGAEITISEDDINRYLQATLLAKQEGLFSLVAGIDSVWVRLHDGYAEIIIERRLQGIEKTYPHNIAYFIQPETLPDGSFTGLQGNGEKLIGLFPVSGKIGNLQVPSLANLLTQPALDNLAASYTSELDLLANKADQLIIKDNRIQFTGLGERNFRQP